MYPMYDLHYHLRGRGDYMKVEVREGTIIIFCSNMTSVLFLGIIIGKSAVSRNRNSNNTTGLYKVSAMKPRVSLV